LLDCPQYTRPADFRGLRVPEVLLGGDHGRIRQWRRDAALEKTARLRPDLFEAAQSRLRPSGQKGSTPPDAAGGLRCAAYSQKESRKV